MGKSKSSAFDKFINPKLGGAKKKEALKQQKRAANAEKKARFEESRNRNYDKYRLVTKDNVIKDSKFAPKKEGKPAPVRKNEFYSKKEKSNTIATFENKESGIMPLNKFLAHAGVCARREAVNLIKKGDVTVNKQVVDEPGFKVDASSDTITYKGKKLSLQKNLVYILINKPKDHLTTTTDPQGRRTVFDIIKNATEERIFPVGRLDRNTTGVLLLTNDGELAQKLTHPSFGIKKVYEVKLDKPLTKKDAEHILEGVTLEDGSIKADSVGFVDPKDKTLIGIEIHSGRNRIVRRIFEYLGYEVKGLDRVVFGNLTKKNVERGHWRYLKEKEVRLLKYLNQSFVKKTAQKSQDADFED
ncbi:MAG: pseudouridine synthase [Chitinophagaceae bacterium]